MPSGYVSQNLLRWQQETNTPTHYKAAGAHLQNTVVTTQILFQREHLPWSLCSWTDNHQGEGASLCHTHRKIG